MARLIGIFATVLLHLGALVYALWTVTPEQSIQSMDGDNRIIVEDAKNSGEVQVRLITEAEADAAQQRSEPGINGAPDDRICDGKDHTYFGIGLLHVPFGMRIISAPSSYPAYQAGARVDDVIEELYRIPGTDYMVLHVVRGEKHLQWRIRMKNICFKEQQ